jgi:NADH-quinone oxidoreductase subunit E
MPLLHLAQLEKGFVDRHQMREIAEVCGITETDVAEIIGFYTLYHDKPEGRLRIQVCNDISCALRGADEFLTQLCERLGIQPGGTTPDGLITVEAVMCLAACDKAPMFQVQGPRGISYHENMTVDKTMEFIAAARKEVK